jgi:DHA1 family bicyclomycin/chloramphenicol resistance-like MFS transporter
MAVSAHRSPSRGLILVISLLSTLGPAATDMYLPALPAMATELGASTPGTQATLGAFLVGMGVGQLIYGPVSDRVGRRPPLLFGIVLFLLGTSGCALATSIQVLIGARFVQALGACAGAVVPRASIRDRFDVSMSARMLSIMMTIAGISPILAPLLGGYLVTIGSWRLIFAAQGVLALTLVFWLFRRFDESRPESARLVARGESVLQSLACVLREPRIMGFVLCAAFNAVVFFTYLVSAPALLMGTYGIAPRAFGWVFAVNALGFICVNQLNVRLLRHHPPQTILRSSRLPTIVAGVALAFDALTGSFGRLGILIPLFFCLSSAGLIGPNAMACALGVDPLRAGAISSVSGSAAFVLGALASTLTGHLQDGTPRPMALIVLAGMLASAAVLYGVALPVASPSPRRAV